MLQTEELWKDHEAFKECTEIDLDAAGEHLERYLTTKLYNRLFFIEPEDCKKDEDLVQRLKKLGRLQPRHLDIEPHKYNELMAELSMNELRKMNVAKCPKEKLQCILKACRVITRALI